MVEMYSQELGFGADRMLGAMNLGFPDRFRLDDASRMKIGDRSVPTMYSGGRVVNFDTSFIDRLFEQTGTVSSIFVREGDIFIRVTSTLKKEDGSRAVGEILDKRHPAYDKLISGTFYRGMARLFGRDFIAKYVPIKDGSRVIGVIAIAVDITDSLVKLRERIKGIKVGDTGYVYVLNADANDKQYGYFIAHPVLEGKSGLELTDADGKYLFREMLEKKHGEIRYAWKRDGSSAAASSIASMYFIPGLNWLVATRADVAELSKGITALQWVMFGAGLVVLLLLPLVVVVVVRRLVTEPLGRLQDYCGEVEHNHDFTLKAPVVSDDEVGHTAVAVQTLLAALRSAFGQILDGVSRLDDAASSLMTTARETTHNSSEASESASGMAASVQEMSVGVNQIADNASEASKLARDAGQRSNEGGAIILDATHEMNAIAEKMRDTSAAISALGEESHQISGIVSMIKEVAEQTNLLALNAAIEAARAGETGRGFAVVADEVRKLAERTTHATAEIAGVTDSIRLRAEQAVVSMSEAMVQVETGVTLAGQAGSAIADIRAGSDRVLDVVRQITESLAESSSASQSMANQTERVALVAEESNHAAQESLKSVEQLEHLARDMRDTVGHFKI